MIGGSLVVVSIAFGILLTLLFSRLADLRALRSARKRVQAHLLEIRLFSAEPRLVWRAQSSLVRANLRVLAILAIPVLVLSIPMAWVWLQLESIYGSAPLRVGRPAIVTAQLRTVPAKVEKNALEAPAGIAVESGPVRSFVERQVSWRVRPNEPVSGVLRLNLDGGTIEKTIDAGKRGVLLNGRKWSSLFDWLLHPEEQRIPSGDVEWVEVRYPETGVVFAGISWPWEAWFLVISAVSALVFARWMKVPL